MSEDQQGADEQLEDLEPGADEATRVVGGAPQFPDVGTKPPPATPPGVPIPYPNVPPVKK
jgi:hypothetical protein